MYSDVRGKPAGSPYPVTPLRKHVEPRKLAELSIVANFVEVFLARDGHEIGVASLEDILRIMFGEVKL